MYGIIQESKFKVGDRMRVVKDGDDFGGSCHGADVGFIDTLVEASTNGCDGSSGWFYRNDEVELVAPAEPASKFKVGDRVMVVDSNGGGKVGDVATVTDVTHSESFGDNLYTLDGLSDGAVMLFGYRLAPAFLPGDKVRVTKHTGYFATGDTGEVERQSGNTVFVRHGSYQRVGLAIDADSLELIAEPEAGNNEQPVAQPKFKAGDVVAYNDDGSIRKTINCFKTKWYDGSDYDGDPAYDYTDGGWDLESYLVLAPGATNPCIVARVVAGTPRPSNIPYVHGSVGAATTEAERLAQNNPGQEFAVYQRVAGRVAEVSYSMKEVA